MNERQWEIFCLWMDNVLRVLDEINKNTQPEDIDEKSTSIKGFGKE